jgi:hypothetical protein
MHSGGENENKRKCGWNIHWIVLNNRHVYFVSIENLKDD